MEINTLKKAQSYTIRTRSDFYILFNLMRKDLKGQLIEIALELSFIEPIDILILTHFIISLYHKEGTAVFSGLPKKTYDYLNSIELLKFCTLNYKAPQTIESIPSYSAMPIRRVERETMGQYINMTAQYFASICKGKDLTMLNLCMSELINNVYDHSHSPIGAYVFCQYYPNIKEIRFSVGDIGIGIPESVNTYMANKDFEILSKIDCVKWAVRERNTTQSFPSNQGRGLDTINSFVKSNRSSWKLYTTDVEMTGNYYAGRRYYDNTIHNFIGTLIEVRIKVENLDDLTDVEEFDW